jgi:predicted DNA-binding transcriptional regulator AlpA
MNNLEPDRLEVELTPETARELLEQDRKARQNGNSFLDPEARAYLVDYLLEYMGYDPKWIAEVRANPALRTREVAEILGMAHSTTWARISEGKIPARKLSSRVWRTAGADVLEFLVGREG